MKAKFSTRPSLQKKVQGLNDKLQTSAREFSQAIAQDLVRLTPVDTGAAVISFSAKPNFSSGRGTSSKGRLRNQDPSFWRAVGLSQLYDDLAAIDFRKTSSVVFSNGAPHWPFFRLRSPGKMTGRDIFDFIKDKYR